MFSRCGELLALGNFGIGVGFNEVQRPVAGEAKVDTGIAIEPQGPVDALGGSLNAGAHLRCKALGRPIDNSHAFLIVRIVFDFLGGDRLAAHGAEFQFPNRQHLQPVVAEHADIEFSPFDKLFGDSGRSDLIVDPNTGLPTTENMGIDAQYNLIEIATNKSVMTGSTFSHLSYDLPGSYQRFSRTRAYRDAEDRAAEEIAEHIQTRLASFFYAGT